VLKANCCRLKSLSLEAFACLEVWLLGHNRSILLSVVTQELCCVTFWCAGFFFSLFRWCQCWLSVGTPYFCELDSVLEPVTGVELSKEVYTSRVRWMPLILEWNPSTNMFYLLRYLLLLNLVIFKLKCNNLIFNETMVLNASYVCLLHSRFVEDHPIWILEGRPRISEVVLSQYIIKCLFVWAQPTWALINTGGGYHLGASNLWSIPLILLPILYSPLSPNCPAWSPIMPTSHSSH
jgi:hypothetical protein